MELAESERRVISFFMEMEMTRLEGWIRSYKLNLGLIKPEPSNDPLIKAGVKSEPAPSPKMEWMFPHWQKGLKIAEAVYRARQ